MIIYCFALQYSCSVTVLLYLFLASSHHLYAELWLDSFSFAGPLGGVRTTASLELLLYFILHCIFRLLSDCTLLPLFRHCLHFCTYAIAFIFLCGLYTLFGQILY